jgi:hypothetical protein
VNKVFKSIHGTATMASAASGPTKPVTICLPSLLKIGGGCSADLPSVLAQLGLRR